MNEMAFRVTSNDGTTIAYDREGSGPAVILVGGALDEGWRTLPWRQLSPSTSRSTTMPASGTRRERLHRAVRRGKEIEDLDALIAEAGGSAHLFGGVLGGALALEAAAAGSAIDTIAVWEVPYVVGDDIRPRFEEYIADTRRAFDAGRDEEVLELFMRVTGASDDNIAARKGRQADGALGAFGRPRAHAGPRQRLPQSLPIAGRSTGNGHPTGPGHHRRADHGPLYGRPAPGLLRPSSRRACRPITPRSTGDPRGADHVVDPQTVGLPLLRFFSTGTLRGPRGVAWEYRLGTAQRDPGPHAGSTHSHVGTLTIRSAATSGLARMLGGGRRRGNAARSGRAPQARPRAPVASTHRSPIHPGCHRCSNSSTSRQPRRHADPACR